MNKFLNEMVKHPIKTEVQADSGKLHLYGTVGSDWDGVLLKDVKSQVDAIKDKSHIEIHINSYGGDATEGVAIRNYLMDEFDSIDVVIDGIAASAASVIALCGDTLTMSTGATLMIHQPWTIAIGNKSDLTKEINALDSLERAYRDIYMERFNGTEDELITLMDGETWLTAEDAERYGFATAAVEEEEQVSLAAEILNRKISHINQTEESIDLYSEETPATKRKARLQKLFKKEND